MTYPIYKIHCNLENTHFYHEKSNKNLSAFFFNEKNKMVKSPFSKHSQVLVHARSPGLQVLASDHPLVDT